MKYYLCFHNGGDRNDADDKIPFLGRWIKFWLDEPWSHIELHRGLLDVGDGFIASLGECFSSRGYGVKRGVSWQKINFSHPHRWTIIQLPDVPKEIDAEIQARAAEIDGCKYDYLGAVNCPHPRLQLRRRYYCIEAVRYALGWKPAQAKFIPTYQYASDCGGKVIWKGSPA
jgi:hypothetical protein